MLLIERKGRFMEANQYVIERGGEFSDVSPIFIGEHICDSGHSFGPYMREYYLIHFCLSGCGVLKDKNGVHKISAGDLFIIRPGEITTYTADKKTPWNYYWIAFSGSHAGTFMSAESVYKTPDDMGERLKELVLSGVYTPEIYISFIYELMHRLFLEKTDSRDDDKVEKLRQYIRYNYMENLRVSALAHSFGFERSYLYRIFKNRYGVGIKEYITEVRMEYASKFLSEGYTVGESAHLVGYDDEFNFSKSFKRRFGVSPSELRARAREGKS